MRFRNGYASRRAAVRRAGRALTWWMGTLEDVTGFGELKGVAQTLPLTRGSTVGRAIIDQSVMHIEDIVAAFDDFPEARAPSREFGQRSARGVALRSRYAEDRLAEAVARGVRQYVLLGAGLDTFRSAIAYPDLTIFEVDYPATQRWKQQRIGEARLAIPKQLRFAPVDFEKETLAEGLRRAGFIDREPAFFSMLGVAIYLTKPAPTGDAGVRRVASRAERDRLLLQPSGRAPDERAESRARDLRGASRCDRRAVDLVFRAGAARGAVEDAGILGCGHAPASGSEPGILRGTHRRTAHRRKRIHDRGAGVARAVEQQESSSW